MPDQDAEKTHDATPHRRQEAREQGEVARSADLAAAVVLVAALGLLYTWWPTMLDFLGGFATTQLGGDAWLDADQETFVVRMRGLLWELTKVLGPLFALVMLAGIGANLMQFGLLFLPEKLMPDLKRLDVLAAAMRIFSMQNLVKLGFGMLKIVLVVVVAYYELKDQIDDVLALSALSLPQTASFAISVLFWTTFKIAAALLVLALVDFGFQWWRHEQDLKMSTQELRDEMKNTQGDPQIIARRRQAQRQLVQNRLKSTVPKADVVVTNPTELAIALQYDPATMAAPVVLAKGAGVLAQRIRQIALEHGIPIIEKKPLAQALYKDVDVNRRIPGALYSAVAEIMAYVYQLKGKTMPERGAA
ncbi:MAG: flagellar biosynthesis protein FlhB [Planctomycetes bacterium]|nr:flagellar biosynthesis protein FlhB [Planctomycetota bacterium]